MLMVLLGSLEECLNIPLTQLWDMMSKQQLQSTKKKSMLLKQEEIKYLKPGN